jgi:hypothetical protein
LLASMMSSIPLLNRFDPLPILKSLEEKENVTDDDMTDTTETIRSKKVDNLFANQKTGK